MAAPKENERDAYGQKRGSQIKDEHRLVYNIGNVQRSRPRVLVTGGCGFIGSHLVEALLKANCDVLCVDSLASGQKDNIIQFLDNPHFEFIRHDVTLPLYVEVDQIYHLACPASPVFYQYNPIKTLKTSFMGTLNMLGLAKRVNARILLTSTSEVYGDPNVHPQVEEYWGNVNPIGIRSCYDEGKRVAESLMFAYQRYNDVDIAVARIFNTYGPKMLANDGRVVSNFIVQALEGEDLTIYGDGSQTRSFCYIDDQIDGLMKLMNSDETGPINIGNPHEYTILQLAESVIRHVSEKFPSNPNLVNRPLPSDDPKKRKPDITKAREKLGWEPHVELDEGIAATVEYFASLLGIESTPNEPNEEPTRSTQRS